ncbi:type 1 fimbrial protein [Pseudomonas nabeulensis]|uniref:Type 1 fimbrial protein n=1 Tax=Pseudomonas nabeulensis TaxID=2293833 RepID=A0A4Z0B7Z5_9PSED|nr:fimbrial protein [Pseudomonas nabeulensis]TFY94434.1 type 1 fimbrial protein [Pseudomonas nabeulensis]
MLIRTLPFLLAIATSLAINTAQAATNGSLNFTGQVNAGTCDLVAGDVNRTVTLPTVKIPDFESSSQAGAIDFEMSAECETDIRNVIFLFTGTPSTASPTLFSNTGTSDGTALWLRGRAPISSATIPANGTEAERSRTIATSNKKAVIPLRASYHKTGVPITAGTFASTMTVSITYN